MRSQGSIELREPVEVIADLLDDLSRGLGVVEAKPMHTSDIATLSIGFEVG